ncbi:MAG: hypothetical protein C0407_02375 [Desulfobacca sp.]|nr:hypothetical protein [Desulfobacca sp.]
MKSIFLLLGITLICCMGLQCQEDRQDQKIILDIEDVPCDQVWERILNSLREKNIPIQKTDREMGTIVAGPMVTKPISGSLFQKMEEHYHIKIKCFEALSSQITCQINLKGLTSADRWVEVKDVKKYENRFLESFFPTNIHKKF